LTSERSGFPAFDSSRRILEHLERANLFLIPLDDERQWYRYHHLFTDFLGQRLRDQELEHIPELHRRASLWYEAEGLMDEAIQHALAAGDPERATYLVAQIAASLVVRNAAVELLKWIDRLPAEHIPNHPVLCVWYAWALDFVGRLSEVEPILQMALASFRCDLSQEGVFAPGIT
jgi:LuxR family maltose regulon positive regulatory protein